MIQANELRIGNLVYDRGGKVLSVDRFCHGKIECDIKVMPNKTLAGIHSHYHPLTEEIEFCDPIPLTEEWLLKFGLKEVYFDVENNKDYILNSLHIQHHLEVNDFVCTNTEPYFISIKSVHQLQNLYFALTGEELTIKE